jgi:hypothetical protein
MDRRTKAPMQDGGTTRSPDEELCAEGRLAGWETSCRWYRCGLSLDRACQAQLRVFLGNYFLFFSF